MKFELDSKDLQFISTLQRYFSLDDELPDLYYRRLTTLVKKINSQIPDKVPEAAKRRIKVFTLDKS